MKNTSELSMFGDIYDIDMSVMQMESIASDLVFLLKHSGLSRSELASKLDWKKSRVTRVLSGDENLTVKTITTIAEGLGYGFDVVFYNENYEQPKQPWIIDRENKKTIATKQINKPEILKFELQTGAQVANDVIAGNEAEQYIRITEFSDKFTNYLIEEDGVDMLPVASSSNNIYTYDLTNEVMVYEY